MYDIFLISDDVAGEKMAGPGIRAWELSKSLSRRFKVALAVPDYSSRSAESTFYKDLPFDLFFYSQSNPAVIKEIGAKSRIVIVQGYILSKFPFLKDLPAYLICDLDHYEGLDNLTFYYDKNPSKLSPIPIKLKQVRHPQWPEIVDDTNFVVGGQSLKSALFARPKS